MDTSQIIKECVSRNESAFRQLVEQYADLTFSVAFRIVNDDEEAKDITQETFISIWMNIEKFDQTKPFKSWLYKIVVNKCLDALRRKKKADIIYPDLSVWNKMELLSHHNPEESLINKEVGQMILLLTEKLSHKQKVVFVLSELEGLTHDEIADATGMVKDAIKSNLNHARRRIAKMIEKHI